MKRQPRVAPQNRGVILALTVVFLMCGLFYLNSRQTSALSLSPKVETHQRIQSKADDDDEQGFLYFAYASDLLESRLKSGGGPTARLVTVGKVKQMRFAYSQESKVWRGGVADIVPTKSDEDEVWGVVYRLADEDLPALDKQKGVGKVDPLYERITVTVHGNDRELQCITYAMVPSRRVSSEEYLPSKQYRTCLLQGAKQAKLPKHYIAKLQSIKDNGSTYERKSVSC